MRSIVNSIKRTLRNILPTAFVLAFLILIINILPRELRPTVLLIAFIAWLIIKFEG